PGPRQTSSKCNRGSNAWASRKASVPSLRTLGKVSGAYTTPRRGYWRVKRRSDEMSIFTGRELAYLREGRRLGRVATVGRDGTPHVVPVGWSHNTEQDTIDVGGRDLEATKKFRDVARGGRAAIVIDDLAST